MRQPEAEREVLPARGSEGRRFNTRRSRAASIPQLGHGVGRLRRRARQRPPRPPAPARPAPPGGRQRGGNRSEQLATTNVLLPFSASRKVDPDRTVHLVGQRPGRSGPEPGHLPAAASAALGAGSRSSRRDAVLVSTACITVCSRRLVRPDLGAHRDHAGHQVVDRGVAEEQTVLRPTGSPRPLRRALGIGIAAMGRTSIGRAAAAPGGRPRSEGLKVLLARVGARPRGRPRLMAMAQRRRALTRRPSTFIGPSSYGWVWQLVRREPGSHPELARRPRSGHRARRSAEPSARSSVARWRSRASRRACSGSRCTRTRGNGLARVGQPLAPRWARRARHVGSRASPSCTTDAHPPGVRCAGWLRV